MKVLKFGGTSVGSSSGRENIKALALDGRTGSVVIVSALSGVTDSLVLLVKEALTTNKNSYKEIINRLRERHFEATQLSSSPSNREATRATCAKILDELELLMDAIHESQQATQEEEARVVAFGERLSSVIVHSMFEDALHIDSQEVIKTLPYFNRHIVDFMATNRLLKERLLCSESKVIIMGGFISSDSRSGVPTNLGRGGSDYTAAIVAAAIGATTLYIYTDVDGFLSSDPRIVPQALLICELCFVDAMELCNFGAKVLYPPTIFPAYNAGIPIVIRNTYSKQCPGTKITATQNLTDNSPSFKGISSINDTALITIQTVDTANLIGINYRIFKALSTEGISIFLVSQCSSQSCTNIAIKNGDANRATKILNSEFKEEIANREIDTPAVIRNLATVAVVGSSLTSNRNITAQIFKTLENNGINIITSGQGGAQNSIAFVTELASMRRATTVLHEALFETRYETLNLGIFGENSVSAALKEHIAKRKRDVMERYGLQLNIQTTANCKKSANDASSFVFVDCTQDNSITYDKLLGSGENIVSANLCAMADFDSVPKGKLRYGAAVGEGLPLVRVLDDLVSSGDAIIEIRGCLSGFMNYVLSLYSKGLRFSVALRTAYNNYYKEVDLLGELSGRLSLQRVKVINKCSKLEISDSQISRDALLHSFDIECSEDELLDKAANYDAHWEELRAKITAEQRYIFATNISKDGGYVGVQVIDNQHPFYNLNSFRVGALIASQRYREYPLQLRSYELPDNKVVTERIFADILSIANIRE